MAEEEQVAVDDTEETSMRDDFEAAYAAVDDAPTETSKPEVKAGGLTTDDWKEETETKAKTPDEKASGEIADTADDNDRTADESASGVEHSAEESEIGAESELKAPSSWTPAAREKWKDLAPEVQQMIDTREGQMNKALEVGKVQRKTGERITGITNRFAQVIAAEGISDPIAGIESMLKIVTGLRMGTPEQKAQKIAEFIKGYDVPIDVLDNMLAGNPSAPVNDPVRKMIDERLKPVDRLLARMDGNERNRVNAANQKARQEIAEFSTKEFYSDVRNDMADFVESAEKRGITMPLQEAYEKACSMNAEVSKVLTDRAASAKLLGDESTLEQKRNAASSISGKQGGLSTKQKGDMSLTESLNAAWDEVG